MNPNANIYRNSRKSRTQLQQLIIHLKSELAKYKTQLHQKSNEYKTTNVQYKNELEIQQNISNELRKKLNELTAKLEAKNTEYERKVTELQDESEHFIKLFEGEQKQWQEKVIKLQNKLSEAEEQITEHLNYEQDLDIQIDTLTLEVEHLNTVKQEYESTYKNYLKLQKANAKLLTEKENLQGEIDTNASVIIQLQAQIDENDSKIQELSAKVDKYKDLQNGWQQQVDRLNEQLIERNEELEFEASLNQQLNYQIELLTNELTHLKTTSENRSSQPMNEELQQQTEVFNIVFDDNITGLQRSFSLIAQLEEKIKQLKHELKNTKCE
ncbi:hypothetical protein LGQ02_05060 [Bacillus shivajii]|uniref:hypothetical protein n=1 Tax=Bacillus shivajii TaxID=1983719 RepID=UPI001CFB06E1|nr:hypothetical protein [Bacillus shivajii]UCZ54135.1 hypothetical protein LGQ02_05060 [Bacillus shivajii]